MNKTVPYKFSIKGELRLDLCVRVIPANFTSSQGTNLSLDTTGTDAVWSGTLQLSSFTTFEYRYVAWDTITNRICIYLSPVKLVKVSDQVGSVDDGKFTKFCEVGDVALRPITKLKLHVTHFVTPLGEYHEINPPATSGEHVDQLAFTMKTNNEFNASSTAAVGKTMTLEFQENIIPTSLQIELLSQSKSVGRAFIMISQLSQYPSVQAPVLDERFNVIGDISLQVLLVTPFLHPRLLDVALRTRLPLPVDSLLMGHRGGGANGARVSTDGSKRTHINENTVLSFGTAASHGAHFVEFDVHLTHDRIPIIFHDFMMTQGNVTLPISSLKLSQFKKFGHRQVTRSSSTEDMTAARAAGFIQDSYPTLHDVFKKVPPQVGFDVEIKYPLKDEADFYDLHSLDRNTYVDTILWTVFEYAGSRNLIFSSFDPDICLLVAAKQPRYPVFFLSEIGTGPNIDYRTTSLEASIDFAKTAELAGLVCPAEALLKEMSLVKQIKDAGLMVCTWGRANNDRSNVRAQQEAGVNGIIVDHVNYIAKNWNKT